MNYMKHKFILLLIKPYLYIIDMLFHLVLLNILSYVNYQTLIKLKIRLILLKTYHNHHNVLMSGIYLDTIVLLLVMHGKIFISNSTRSQLIYEKCIPINTDKFSNQSLNSPLHWGVKYEEISIQWYQLEHGGIIDDFGCVPHPTLSCLVASPDGINTDPSSNHYGRMLEIKNIVNREINGNPKMEYWIQTQLQMEVCNLNECDFLETRFIEYDSKEDFEQDGTFTETKDNKLKRHFYIIF